MKERSDTVLISLGSLRWVNTEDIAFVADIDTIVSKTYINRIKEAGMLIDISAGKKVRTVIMTKQGAIITSDLKADTIFNRITNVQGE